MTPASLDTFRAVPRIAYLSMEIALESAIPTYSGGLGVLAGDTLRSAADLALPMVAVTLASRAGYFRQHLDEAGRQSEQDDTWDPGAHAEALPARVAVDICGRKVWIASWLYRVNGHGGAQVPVLLLDTDLGDNDARDRTITHHLYGGDAEYRLKQEIVLGIGGARMLDALGFDIRRYHLNEGHAALLCLALLRRTRWSERPGLPARALLYNVQEVRSLCAFTTHTPVAAGHDRFGYDLVERVMGNHSDPTLLRELAGEDNLNMTTLALNLAGYVNGVARSHAEQSRRMFPGYEVNAITNGVHATTWTNPGLREIYSRHFPSWCHEPEVLMGVTAIDAEEIHQAHQAAKRMLLEHLRAQCGRTLREEVFTLCFARRMTSYKRPALLFSDLDRLRRIAARHPLQIVIAGKAHPHDNEGKQLIEAIHRHLAELRGSVEAVFVPGYSMNVARLLVAGADVWLNTPLPPLEASGTSGMKAAFNGVPSLSVLDGWWIEGCIEGVTGWAIGTPDEAPERHAERLLDKLEHTVLPLYYGERAGWLRVMQGAIAHNGALFNTHRMMRRYVTEAYLQR